MYKNKIGDIFLADIGIPNNIFLQMGINYICPFNEKFIIKLYNS